MIELADRVQALQVEALCWCGHRATQNARVVDGVMVVQGEQVALGGITAGEVGPGRDEGLCRRHYMRRSTSHAAHNAVASPEVLPFDPDFCPIQPPIGNV